MDMKYYEDQYWDNHHGLTKYYEGEYLDQSLWQMKYYEGQYLKQSPKANEILWIPYMNICWQKMQEQMKRHGQEYLSLELSVVPERLGSVSETNLVYNQQEFETIRIYTFWHLLEEV